LPTSAFDTFFACTIIVAVALIGMAFLGSTMHNQIASTQDINKDSYLKAIADHIVTSPGTPVDWGTSGSLPVDFGLASADSNGAYELDMDKISRLNPNNAASISYLDLSSAAKLNVALGIKVAQVMDVDVLQVSNSTVGSDTSFVFQVTASINSEPTNASIHGYVVADAAVTEVDSALRDGSGQITVQVPTSETGNALLVVFARSSIDDRITSYAIYDFAQSAQQTTPGDTALALSLMDYSVSFNDSVTGLTVQNSYVLSYSYQQPLSSFEDSQASIPRLIDPSPLIVVVNGLDGSTHFAEWASYPQVPISVGASFDHSEQNVSSYLITINGLLYRLDLSLGDLPK
jgi:hypothetical protein